MEELFDIPVEMTAEDMEMINDFWMYKTFKRILHMS